MGHCMAYNEESYVDPLLGVPVKCLMTIQHKEPKSLPRNVGTSLERCRDKPGKDTGMCKDALLDESSGFLFFCLGLGP